MMLHSILSYPRHQVHLNMCKSGQIGDCTIDIQYAPSHTRFILLLRCCQYWYWNKLIITLMVPTLSTSMVSQHYSIVCVFLVTCNTGESNMITCAQFECSLRTEDDTNMRRQHHHTLHTISNNK